MLYVNKYLRVCVCLCMCCLYKNLFQKLNAKYLIFIKSNIGIKIKIGYYPLDRWCGVPNIFPTRNRISKSKIFGTRL